jgi:hypothetical protein
MLTQGDRDKGSSTECGDVFYFGRLLHDKFGLRNA